MNSARNSALCHKAACNQPRTASAVLIAISIVCRVAAASDPGFWMIGPPGIVNGECYVETVSADGSRASGAWQNNDDVTQIGAYTWSKLGGRVDVTDSTHYFFPRSASGDGQTVVGDHYPLSSGFGRPAVLNRNNVPVEIGTFPASIVQTSDPRVSPNGRYIAGMTHTANFVTHNPFLYDTSTASTTLLPTISNFGADADVYAVTDQGDILGNAFASRGAPRGVLWRHDGTRLDYQTVPGADYFSTDPKCMSYDASRAWGTITMHAIDTLVGWDGSGRPINHGSFPAVGAILNVVSCSADGSVVFGHGNNGTAGSEQLFLWIQSQGGFVLFRDYLSENGIIIPPGVSFTLPKAISADGLTFTGMCTDASGDRYGFLVTVPTAGSMCPLVLCGVWATRRRRGRSAQFMQQS
jgi:uncharacterized membrane protein